MAETMLSNNSESRKSDEILLLAQHAKLDTTDLIPFTQTLVFPEDYGNEENNITLLEADSDILDSLSKGERIVIRGEPEEFSVLCTDSKTYEVREAETSNSCLLIPYLKIPEEIESENHSVVEKKVSGIHYKYLELRQCQPRLGKLLRVLEQKTYQGRNSGNFGYKWDELCHIIQSSEKELLEGLKTSKAYYYKDIWCALDFDYHFGVLSSILNLIDSNSLSIYALDKDEVMETLKELEPPLLLDQCFDYFFIPTDTVIDGKCYYKINAFEVSRFCAEVLLKSSGKFNLNEFLNIWQQSVPEGVNTHLTQLRGLALVNEESSPPVIWYFPVYQVPLDTTQAFSFLFETRPKWTLEDITPYLQEFLTPKLSTSALLTKQARSSTVNGVKYFTARHSR